MQKSFSYIKQFEDILWIPFVPVLVIKSPVRNILNFLL